MNERQENVYQQYPTYENFLAAQGPNQILINFSNIHEIEESISVPRLSIAEMNEIYLRNDFNPGIDYYVKWLNFFNKFSNINKAMPMDIVNWAAIQLYLRYCHFYFADLKVIFEKILEAKYGKFFGSVDTVLIMSAFLQYNEERERLLHKEKERKAIEYESWRKVRSEQLRTEVYNELSSKHPDWLTGQIYEHMNQVVVQRIALEAKERFKIKMAKQVKQLGIAQNSIGFNDGDKLQKAVDFILDTYDIRKAMYDPAKIYVRYKDKELDEGILDFDRISLDLQEYGISISDTILKKILRSDKYIKAYNPIKEYFDKIRGSFKDPSQIELLSKHLIARSWDDKPEGYYQERAGKLLKKWLVACVACWLGGHQNEVMLTLIQMKEGVGKTYFSEWIVPDCLKEYYVKSKREDRFDMEDAFTRNMIVCFDELVGLTKGTADIFKATIATKNIWVKRRNDEYPIARPRLACAIGTTNRNQELNGFLQECFGYRRFACIELADINREYSKLCDKDLLWAEALMLYENSAFDYIFNQEDFDEFKAYNQRYVVEYPALKYVRLYLARPDGPDEGQMLNPTEICKALRKANKINREDLLAVNPQKVGAALTSLGYIQKSDRSGSTPRYRYHVILNI